MPIDLYAACWNEERIILSFFGITRPRIFS